METNKMKKFIAVLTLSVLATFMLHAHIPGPYYIYKCPQCSALLKKGSNRSGNTFGATLYSDGKFIAPMYPEFPNLTKCKKCNTILWLSDLKSIGTCEIGDEDCKPEWQKADEVDFLQVNDLFRALESDSVKSNVEREKQVRKSILWAFNDRLRENQALFIQDDDEALWTQNNRRLMELLDTSDINEKIMAAELNRYLGEFDVSITLLNSIEDENFRHVIEKFKAECVNKNKELFKIF